MGCEKGPCGRREATKSGNAGFHFRFWCCSMELHRKVKLVLTYSRQTPSQADTAKVYWAAPTIPGFDIAGAAYPADEASGDYFDFTPLPHHCLGIAVGDVEGHGFGSALVMALTRAYVQSFAAMGRGVDLKPGESHPRRQFGRRLLRDADARIPGRGHPIPGVCWRGSHPGICAEPFQLRRTHPGK